MPSHLQVKLDASHYTDEETVSGTVVLQLGEPSKVAELTLELRGEASAYFTDFQHLQRSQRRYHRELYSTAWGEPVPGSVWSSTNAVAPVNQPEAKTKTEPYTSNGKQPITVATGNIAENVNSAAAADQSNEVAYQDPDSVDLSVMPGGNKTAMNFKGTQEYLQQSLVILGGGDTPVKLVPGSYSYPFSLKLPGDLPPSFEGKHGHIRYSAHALLDQQEAIATFIIMPPLMAGKPQDKVPITLEKECQPWLGCCMGSITAKVTLPCTSFKPGETISCTVSVDNRSRQRIEDVTCYFKKVTIFYANHPYENNRRDDVILVKYVLGNVEKKASNKWTKEMIIPQCPASISNCDIIALMYTIKVDVPIAGLQSNIKFELPIMLNRNTPTDSSNNTELAVPTDNSTVHTISLTPSLGSPVNSNSGRY